MMIVIITGISILILSIVFYLQSVNGKTPLRFRIVQDDRIGYINEKGKIVIPPTYLGGNEFSEGLAAVRNNGLYGFIDVNGKFVIQPAYDFASEFINGVAAVFLEDKLLYINKKGEVILPSVYRSLAFIDDEKAYITTVSKRQGIIDISTKELLIDTVFSSVETFENRIAIVQEYISPDSIDTHHKQVGIVRLNGSFIVPFGKYDQIDRFVDGLAVVKFRDAANHNQRSEGVIDTSGNLVFKRICTGDNYISGNFCEGFAKMSLYRSDKSTDRIYYEGFINLKGEVVLNNPDYRFVNEFSNGRVFVREEDGDYILLDRNFKRIGNNTYTYIVNDRFQDGYAIVKTKDGYGIIDTMANFVAAPKYDMIDRIDIINDRFFFSIDEKDDMLYGIADLHGNVITKGISQIDESGFVNGLLRVVINDRLQYLNKKGVVIWEQQKENSALKPLNIDYMNRGYFNAYSRPENPEDNYGGGWAISPNLPEDISGQKFPQNSLAVTIDTTRIDTFYRYMGYELFVSNTTIDTRHFDAQDSRLYLNLQAQDKHGEWRDIEYFPGSWCGNSYHKLKLLPNTFWRFTIPDYHGEFKTKIRAKLKVINKLHPDEEEIVYSNIINGSVNPGQFWNKMPYRPVGIMDPYYN